jgi:signal transduction histidine kinase
LDLSEERQAKRELTELNAALEQRVRERSAALEQANCDLSETLTALQQTQRELINAEKAASLATLVAGIAHEMNTPIGNALLTATAMDEQSRALEQLLAQGRMSKSGLTTYLGNARQGCALLVDALTRAADLISSFKQVSVGSQSEGRAGFDLALLITDTFAAFGPSLDKAGCRLDLQLAPGLRMDSNTDGLRRIFDNLIKNALTHAFAGTAEPLLTIATRELDGDKVEIAFSDNGCGMSEEVLKKVFDPFFTTRMGQGNTGLGMSAVYNIATSLLGGQVDVRSIPGVGTTVTLLVPKTAPNSTATLP